MSAGFARRSRQALAQFLRRSRGQHDHDRQAFKPARQIVNPAKRLFVEPMRVIDE
jgi:hypothetical protein